MAGAELLRWGTQAAKKHPLLATLGVLAILLSFTLMVAVALKDNERFPQVLLALLGISLAIYFTFSPAPSAGRAIAGLVFSVLWLSLLLDKPLEIGMFVNEYLRRSKLPPSTTVLDQKGVPPLRNSAPTAPAREDSTLPPSLSKPPVTYETVEFSNLGASVNVACENSATSSVSLKIPENAKILSSGATWVDTSNLSSVEATTTVKDGAIVATGSIRGLDAQNINLIFGSVKNCPGGGQGALKLSGLMQVPK